MSHLCDMSARAASMPQLRRTYGMLSFAVTRKRAVFALRAEFSSLSFPKEKGTKKKGNLKAYALKNPPIVQSCDAQSRTVCLTFPPLRVALCVGNLYEKEKTR